MGPIRYLIAGDFTGFLLQLLYLLPAIVIALSFHEAAHAWMANRMGDPTAKTMGRLTLDPTKHFELFGIITFLVVGFGWGKPVPTNPRNYHNYKKGNVLVAIAGVTTNMIIALVVMIVMCALILSGVFKSFFPVLGTDITSIIHAILFYIVYLNLYLCFFNLIPIPPLDGHHLVKGFIARKSPNFYMAYQRYGYLVLILLLFATSWVVGALSFLSNLVISGVTSLFGVPLFGFLG